MIFFVHFEDRLGLLLSLLNPNDPAAFSQYRLEKNSGLLFTSDHNGDAIPQELDCLGVPKHELRRHVAYDIGINAVAHYLSKRFDAPLIVANYSRLVIDCNRRPGSSGSIPAVSDKTEIPGNKDLDPHSQKLREEEIFYPYHNAIDQHLRRWNPTLQGRKNQILIALHSFTPVMDGVFRPWQIGVLWKDDKRLAYPLISSLRENGSLNVGDNKPYSGSEPAGYTFLKHVPEHNLISVAVEFRQDLIEFTSGAEKWAEIFASSLEKVIPSLDCI